MDDDARPQALRPLLRGLVALVAIGCFVWVLSPLVRDLGTLADRVHWARFTAAIAAAALFYALSCVLLVEAWRRWLGTAELRPSLRDAWWCFGRSQWAKYLPTNTLHYVGRQVLGRRLGLRQVTLASASLLEMLSLLAVALAMAVVFGRDQTWASSLPVPWPWLLGIVAAALLLWPLGLPLLRRMPLLRNHSAALESVDLRRNLRALAVVVPTQTLFLLFSALLASGIYRYGWSEAAQTPFLFPTLAWAMPAAWAAGTVALGAPAGIGVREAVFVLALRGVVSPVDAAGLALAWRVVTVLGDALVAASTLGLEPTAPPKISGSVE